MRMAGKKAEHDIPHANALQTVQDRVNAGPEYKGDCDAQHVLFQQHGQFNVLFRVQEQRAAEEETKVRLFLFLRRNLFRLRMTTDQAYDQRDQHQGAEKKDAETIVGKAVIEEKSVDQDADSAGGKKDTCGAALVLAAIHDIFQKRENVIKYKKSLK